MRYLWLLAPLLACAETEDGLVLDGGLPRDGGIADGGAQDAGAGDSGLLTGPLLERPVDERVTCSVAAPLRNLRPLSWGYGGATAVVRGQEVLLVREESEPPNPFEFAPAYLTTGVLGPDGQLTSQRVYPETTELLTNAATVVVQDRLYLAWGQEDGLYFSRQTENGYSQPRRLALNYQPGYYSALVEGHGALALVWEEQSFDSGNARYRWARLDLAGEVVGTPRLLGDYPIRTPPVLLPTASGWVALLPDENDLVIKFFDAEGAETSVQNVARGGDNKVAAGVGFDRGQLALVALESGYLAAWVESNQGGSNAGTAFGGIRLGRLDQNGILQEAPIWVRAPEFDIDEVEPRLHRVGNKVALTWGRGSHIYICAGCVPDHQVNLVWLDPVRLVPLSQVARISPPDGVRGGGILRRAEGLAGEHLVFGAGLTFHVHAEPATGAFRCIQN